MISGRSTLVFGIALSAGIAFPAHGDVLLQYFESRWETIERRMPDVFVAGYAGLWLPPPGRADTGTSSAGYDVFDRFHLGSPTEPTLYGNRGNFAIVIDQAHHAGLRVYTDLILNHNGFRDHRTPSFEEDGGYPGFAVKLSRENDKFGDFHDPNAGGRLNERISGLIDIAQEKNYTYIRHPVEESADNLPYKPIRNENRALYPDRDLPPNELGLHPFNFDDPLAGDPVLENATGLLLRHVQWMVEVVGVDGFRLDAVKHIPEWFFDDFYDAVLWQRGRPGLDGTPTTPFSFGEAYDSSWDLLSGYIRKDGFGNRDVLDFPLFFALRNELSGSGFGKWGNIVGSTIDGSDGNDHDGTRGVSFAGSHDDGQLGDALLAHAYILTRPGLPLVYFNAGQFGSRNFPKPGRDDALGNFDPYLTTLLDIHNEYVRDTYYERSIDDDVLVYERRLQCLVALNDNRDTSQRRYDERTVQTSWLEGTRLHELTGNADDDTLDPNGEIPSLVVVDKNRRATIRVPRNVNGRGYLIFGPANPNGTLSLAPLDGEIAPDSDKVPAKLRRATAVPVLTAAEFEIRLDTTSGDPDDPDTDDNALFRIDCGGDFNANGAIDILTGDFAGFEQFLTEHDPLFDGGAGVYRQTIDTSTLDEGYHYLTVLAFRHRTQGEPIFESWRQPIYIDRADPTANLIAPTQTGDKDVTTKSFLVVARGLDRSVNRVHAIFDRALSDDVLSLISDNNKMTRDGSEFSRRWNNIVSGNHTVALVAFEDSGRHAIFRYKGIHAENGFGAGPGDCNRDGSIDFEDIDIFVDFLVAGFFDPTADINADGEVDFNDIDPFVNCLVNGGCP